LIVTQAAAAVAICGIAVLLIRIDLRKTRESIKAAGSEVSQEVRAGIAQGVDHTLDRAAELPGKVLKDVRDVLLDPSTPNGERADRRSVPPHGGDAPNASTSTPTGGDQQAAKAKDPEKPSTSSGIAGADPLFRQMFKLGHQFSKIADDAGQNVFGLSTAEEIRLGKQVHRLTCRQKKTLNAPTAIQRLEKLANPLLAQVTRTYIKYTFTVVVSPELNASSHLGGYVYVNDGLLKFVKSDEELQAVVGHEIGHVELGHCSRNYTYAVRAGQIAPAPVAAVVGQAYHLVEVGYSEDQEFAADSWCFRAMLKSGRTPEQALASARHFVRHLGESAPQRPSASEDGPLSVVGEEIDKHMQSHPLWIARLRRLESLAESMGKAEKSRDDNRKTSR